MFLKKRKPQKIPILDRRRSMEGIPVRHRDMELRRTGDGGMIVIAHFPRGPGVLALFAPPMLEHRVELDELGAFVMEHVDGTRTVLDIVQAFHKRFALNFREAQLCTVAFIRKLVQRRLVSIAIP